MNERILRMYTAEGFRELFLEELASRTKEDPSVSREKVFDDLNEEWYKVMESFRYSNYDSFRKCLQKSYQK